MREYLENQAHLRPGFLMELWVLKVIRETKVRREKRVTQAFLVLQDCQGDQDLWVQKVNPLWVLQVLLVLLASLDPLGSDALVPEGHLALLDPQDLHLHMDQLSVYLALLVLLVPQVLQVMPTR